MSEKSKDATIKKIYEHPMTGYGSINETLKQASKINPSIKVADVRDYLLLKQIKTPTNSV